MPEKSITCSNLNSIVHNLLKGINASISYQTLNEGQVSYLDKYAVDVVKCENAGKLCLYEIKSFGHSVLVTSAASVTPFKEREHDQGNQNPFVGDVLSMIRKASVDFIAVPLALDAKYLLGLVSMAHFVVLMIDTKNQKAAVLDSKTEWSKMLYLAGLSLNQFKESHCTRLFTPDFFEKQLGTRISTIDYVTQCGDQKDDVNCGRYAAHLIRCIVNNRDFLSLFDTYGSDDFKEKVRDWAKQHHQLKKDVLPNWDKPIQDLVPTQRTENPSEALSITAQSIDILDEYLVNASLDSQNKYIQDIQQVLSTAQTEIKTKNDLIKGLQAENQALKESNAMTPHLKSTFTSCRLRQHLLELDWQIRYTQVDPQIEVYFKAILSLLGTATQHKYVEGSIYQLVEALATAHEEKPDQLAELTQILKETQELLSNPSSINNYMDLAQRQQAHSYKVMQRIGQGMILVGLVTVAAALLLISTGCVGASIAATTFASVGILAGAGFFSRGQHSNLRAKMLDCTKYLHENEVRIPV